MKSSFRFGDNPPPKRFSLERHKQFGSFLSATILELQRSAAEVCAVYGKTHPTCRSAERAVSSVDAIREQMSIIAKAEHWKGEYEEAANAYH